MERTTKKILIMRNYIDNDDVDEENDNIDDEDEDNQFYNTALDSRYYIDYWLGSYSS